MTIELIQVDSSGEPLSVGETLDNLQKLVEELEKSDLLSGAELDSVSPIVPSEHAQISHYSYGVVILMIALCSCMYTRVCQWTVY